MRFLVLLILCLTAPGCCVWTTDLSKNPTAWGEYQKNQIYVLQEPAYLMNSTSGWYRDVCLKKPDRWNVEAQIRGTLTPGTRMQAIKLIETEVVGITKVAIPQRAIIMKILDGSFVGQKVNVYSQPSFIPLLLDPQYLVPEQ